LGIAIEKMCMLGTFDNLDPDWLAVKANSSPRFWTFEEWRTSTDCFGAGIIIVLN